MNIQETFNSAHFKYRKLAYLGKLASARSNKKMAEFFHELSADYSKVAERCANILMRGDE